MSSVHLTTKAATSHGSSRAEESRTYSLLEAAREGNIAMVQLLLQAGANVNQMYQDETTNCSEPAGTALHAAVGFEQVAVVQLLLDSGADAKVKDSWGRTPLEMALEKARQQEGFKGKVVTILSNHLIMKIVKRPDW